MLTDWYELDTNAVPPVLVLQPISSLLPNFLNKNVPHLQEKDQAEWWAVLCALQGRKEEFQAKN